MCSRQHFALLVALVFCAGCSFVFGDSKYVSNDGSFPFDTGDAGDADGGDGDTLPDGATGCVVEPELCTEGTRCGSDGRCVPCDADGDGAEAPDTTCDAAAGGDPRDCDDDDADVYPGAAPVCGDGKINGCDAGPMAFREALSVAEIGAIGSEERRPVPPGEDLASLALDVAGSSLLLAWAEADGDARLFEIDAETLGELTARAFMDDDVMAIDVRRVGANEAFISFLSRDAGGDAVLWRGRWDATAPAGAFAPVDYAFDDGPCVTAADAVDIDGDLSIDGASGTAWVLGGSDRVIYAPETGALSCISLSGEHRSAGTDGPVIGLVDPSTGVRRTLRGLAPDVDVLDPADLGATRIERPGYAFLRAATADLYLSAVVGDDGRTRLAPVECTTGVSCAAGGDGGAVFDAGADVAATYSAALDGLTGDFAAMIQIEERATAPAPDDRGHDVVLRILEYPNAAVGSAGSGAPGEALLLHRHTFDSADRDHPEVREVDVAAMRDAASGDITVYWAALIGDRRLAPGSPEDPAADNEARFGGVRFCVSE